MSEQQGQSEAQPQGEQQSELDPQQRQQEPSVPVVGDVVPTGDDLVPDEPETRQDLDRVGSLNAGGAHGHTPDHGDANASSLAGDPEAEGASDAPEGE